MRADTLSGITQITSRLKTTGSDVVMSLHGGVQSRGYNSNILVGNLEKKNNGINPINRVNTVTQKMLTKFQDDNAWLDFFHISSENLNKQKEFSYSNVINLHSLHGNYFSKFALPYLSSIRPLVWSISDFEPISDHAASISGELKFNDYGFIVSNNLADEPALSKDTRSFLCKSKKHIYNHSDFTIVVNSAWMKSIVSKSVLGEKKIEVIHEGVDMNNVFVEKHKDKAKTDLGLPIDKLVVIIDTDMEVMTSAIKNFVISNQDKYQFYSFQKLEGLAHLVLEIDAAEETVRSDYFSAADLFFYFSQDNLYPTRIIESLASGTPVVSYLNGAEQEILNEENGYLVKADRIDSFANEVSTIMENPARLEKMKSKSRTSVFPSFSSDKMVTNYENLYKEIFKKSKEFME